MLSISEGIVTLVKADKQDEQYVKECKKEEDFVQYIGIESTNKEECFIMFADKKRIGLFFLRDDTSFGLNIGRLSVYVDRKYRLLSANCILKAIGYSLHKNYEKLEFMVLKNNYKASSYMETYVLEAMCRMGCVSEALDRMQARFGNMVTVNLEKGYSTLWEYFEEGMGTWNHAWSAGGVYLLSAYVGGVRPLTPGYETCIIAPDFSHTDTVNVTVSTAKGIISVEGTAQQLNVTLPEGVTAEVQLPGSEVQIVSGAGTHTITVQ